MASRERAVRGGAGTGRAWQGAVVEGLSVPVLWLEPGGVVAGMNPAAERLFGDRLAPGRPFPWALEELGLLGPPGSRLAEVQREFALSDGTLRTFAVRFEDVRAAGDGRVTGTAVTLTDVTERRQADVERRRLDLQLHEARRLEGLAALAGGVAHDFNNVLMGVLGHIESALQDCSCAEPVREHLVEATRDARRAAGLCKRLLSYAGTGGLAVEPVRLGDVVLGLRGLLEAVLPPAARLELSLDPNLPVIEADPAQLRQALLNLVTNAAEAIGQGSGTITVRTRVVDVAEARPPAPHPGGELPSGTCVLVEVEDDGCGMREATLSRLFEPFFTTKLPGRGLGLPAVQGIVRRHRGALRVESETDRGSTFRLFLPLAARAPAPPVAPAQGEVREALGGLVLVADDEPTVRVVASRLLTKAGFSVITASDGQEAVDLFAQRAGELTFVLLDLGMPRLGGVEAFRAMQRLGPSVPVILSSGYDEREAADRLAGVAPAGFIQKPYDLVVLLETLHQALRHAPRP